ncbi:multidrug effflux MFS transporter [Brumicola pallidula]|uniref:Bcr/CflA family efflux transporter n=1 Tax=Brumicola pallidula DSM 14239 = ACAM 615 TaxID=1121922 RepID=K6ZW24_9ALTE|nr:multidrug effflux MFS transporter [Glaciecola pallidula]GAC27525.1 MFS transporter, DHA1 family, bicyclomycin/chloramphenicol resistance protein [Glaciecola pallidula DSM 14239 = ACAM 615]
MTTTTTTANIAIKPPLPLLEFIALMALLTSLVALSIDAMLPALNQIGSDLNSQSTQQTYLVISLFFGGMALGQIFFGPFSDARGRRLTILVGLIIFIMGTFVCYFAQSIEVLLFGRLIQAFGVSGPRVASMAVIRDQYAGDAMARVMSFITVIFILVPMVAPLVGQAVMQYFHWREIFTVFWIVAVIAGGWFFLRQPETLIRANRKKFAWHHFFRSCLWLLKQPQVMGYSIAMGCIFGAFLAYLSGSQTIFQEIYDTGEWFPLVFATLAFSIGLASLFNGLMVMKWGMHSICGRALFFSLVFGVALTAITLYYDGIPPLWLFISIMFFGFFFIGMLFGNLNALAMLPVGHMAGLGAAFIGSLTSVIAVPIATGINLFLSDELTPIAFGFLIFSVLSFFAVQYAKKTPAPEL